MAVRPSTLCLVYCKCYRTNILLIHETTLYSKTGIRNARVGSTIEMRWQRLCHKA